MLPERAHSRTPVNRPHAAPRSRSAFTLIELLVAVGILVLLVTLVIAGFQRDDEDHISSSTRTLQSYLEGARSRAIADRQVRGVRLIPSQTDGRVIDSLVYVGASGIIDGTLGGIVYIPRTLPNPGNPPMPNPAYFAMINAFPPDTAWSGWRLLGSPLEWARLNQGGRNLLRPGNRIQVPAGTGNWYTITGFLPLDPVVAGQSALLIEGHYTPSVWNPSASTYNAQPATNVPYRLELATTPLPNQEPVQLDTGIVIDLDASQLPSTWRPAGAGAYPGPLEILFDERGSPYGDVRAGGLLHLYLTTVADVELTRNLINTNHPANGGTAPAPGWPWPIVPANAPKVPQIEPRVVTLFLQTGQSIGSQVNFTDTVDNVTGSAPRDYQADNPYIYARRGMEAK